jgi:hypothetical protein
MSFKCSNLPASKGSTVVTGRKDAMACKVEPATRLSKTKPRALPFIFEIRTLIQIQCSLDTDVRRIETSLKAQAIIEMLEKDRVPKEMVLGSPG